MVKFSQAIWILYYSSYSNLNVRNDKKGKMEHEKLEKSK